MAGLVPLAKTIKLNRRTRICRLAFPPLLLQDNQIADTQPAVQSFLLPSSPFLLPSMLPSTP